MKSRGRTKVHQTMVINWLRKICGWPATTKMTRADFERLLETVPSEQHRRARKDGGARYPRGTLAGTAPVDGHGPVEPDGPRAGDHRGRAHGPADRERGAPAPGGQHRGDAEPRRDADESSRSTRPRTSTGRAFSSTTSW